MWAYTGRRMAVPIYRRHAFKFSLLPAHILRIQDHKVINILLWDEILLPSFA